MCAGCRACHVDACQSLIRAGWLPQDGTCELELSRGSRVERNRLQSNVIAHSQVAGHSKTLADNELSHPDNCGELKFCRTATATGVIKQVAEGNSQHTIIWRLKLRQLEGRWTSRSSDVGTLPAVADFGSSLCRCRAAMSSSSRTPNRLACRVVDASVRSRRRALCSCDITVPDRDLHDLGDVLVTKALHVSAIDPRPMGFWQRLAA
jgi:hypothetical protein